jgi:hypothetical protein
MIRYISCSSSLAFAAVLLACGCEDKPAQPLAPTASALEAPKPPVAGAQAFVIDEASSKVDFTMDAELEKIFGRAPGALTGELFVDPKDVTKSTGLVKLDLDKLSIYQKKREKADQEFGEETKNEKQNKDMRTWFQIEADAPADQREKNRWVEFKIDRVENASAKDVTALPGAERKVTMTVSGDFRLHQRVTKKSAKVEVAFKYEGDKLQALQIKSLEPVDIGLEEHDVQPRSAFSKLADKGLDALGQKVAKIAKISLELGAKAK